MNRLATNSAAEALREKAALLARPETHGRGVAAVETVETHMSLVFLAGPTVYKLRSRSSIRSSTSARWPRASAAAVTSCG